VAETLTWVFDGMEGVMGYFLVHMSNTLGFLIGPLPLFFWILYLYYQIYEDMGIVKRVIKYLSPIIVVSTLLTLSNPFTAIFFTVDSQNHYHRGPLIGIALIESFGFLVFAMLLATFTSKITSFKKKFPLIFFSVPPLVGIVLQMSFYGLRVLWGSVSISILIAYIYMQNRTIGTDYLTGLHNRRSLDAYLQDKIQSKQPDELLGALFIDIDKFKDINDSFGHKVGDRALTSTAKLLRRISRSKDFIARYGGDEFVILLSLKSEQDIQKIVSRIREHCRIFNQTSNELFDLNFSIGSSVYKKSDGMTPDAFFSYLDSLMYEDKNHEAQEKNNR